MAPPRRLTPTVPADVLLLLLAAAVAVCLPPAAGKCLERLETHPVEFDACRRGTTCFLFVPEPPLVIVDGLDDTDAPGGPRTPFPCGDAAALHGLRGVSFDLHDKVAGLWPGNGDLCAYAGGPTECTFTELVAYMTNVQEPTHPAYGMALGVAGMLVHTAERSLLALQSASIFEDHLLLVRKRNSDDGAFLMRPLDRGAWLLVRNIFIGFYGAIFLVCFFAPGPIWKVRLGLPTLRRYGRNLVQNTVGGALDGPERYFEPARAVVLATPFVLGGMVLVFYEGAFIAEQVQPRLTESIRRLSQQPSQLCRYTVKVATATEQVFIQLANVDSRRPVAIANLTEQRDQVQVWNTCTTVNECIEQVIHAETNHHCRALGARATTANFISWGTVIHHAFKERPELCRQLEVVDLREDAGGALPIQRFNLGWLFGNVTLDDVSAAAAAGAAAPTPTPTPTGAVTPTPVPVAPASVMGQLLARRAEVNFGILQGRMDGRTAAFLNDFRSPWLPCQGPEPDKIHASQLRAPLSIVLAAMLGLSLALSLAYPCLKEEPGEAEAPPPSGVVDDGGVSLWMPTEAAAVGAVGAAGAGGRDVGNDSEGSGGTVEDASAGGLLRSGPGAAPGATPRRPRGAAAQWAEP